jgi:hypothetical protein
VGGPVLLQPLFLRNALHQRLVVCGRGIDRGQGAPCFSFQILFGLGSGVCWSGSRGFFWHRCPGFCLGRVEALFSLQAEQDLGPAL